MTTALAGKQDNNLRTKAVEVLTGQAALQHNCNRKSVQQLYAIPVRSVQHTCAPYINADTLLVCLHEMGHAGTMNYTKLNAVYLHYI